MSACLDENSALELIEGRLTSEQRALLERHLEACDACRELAAALAQVGGAGSRTSDARLVDTELAPPVAVPGRPPQAPDGSVVPLAPGAHAGPYRIERAVGQGAGGVVYRAMDARTGRVVALKQLTDATLRSRFAREAQTLRRLDHPGIVRYVEHFELPDGSFLAMEWLDGEDLERCLARGPLDWRAARVLGMRVADALAHAHALGCVHRDLSPKNVFLPHGRFEHAKILDFGLARVPDPGPERTTSRAVLGTPYYMSPEQVRDPKSVDGRSDLFGLGVLLYEALSGRLPFEGADLFSVWVKIVDHPAPDLRPLAPWVPEPFVRLVEQLLQKDPAARPPSGAHVARALASIDAPLAAAPGASAVGMAPTVLAAPYASPPAPPMPPMPMASHPPLGASAPHALTTSAPRLAPPRSSPWLAVVAIGVGLTVVTISLTGAWYARAARAKIDDAKSDDAKSGVAPTASVTAPASATGDKDDAPPEIATEREVEDAPPAKTKGGAGGAKHAQATDAGPPAAGRHYFCGSGVVDTQRGGRYAPRPEFAEVEAAITAGGGCKVTFEDCVITGPKALSLLNDATVTLRRCKVQGSVQLVGESTLHLYGTTLPERPFIVGKGHVIRH